MIRARTVLIGAWTVLALGGFSAAFHDGGVGRCDGCHITHEGIPAGDGRLLVAESASDVCLLCHDGPGGVLGTDPLAPPPERGAGSFVFLLEDNLNDAPDGLANPIRGEAAGHNIVAPGRGLIPDTRHPVAPGGTFPSSQLGCTSCHDPHGTGGFRSLYGQGAVQGGIGVFSFPAPQADGIGLGSIETDARHTAYRGGVSDWCANCHGRYHDHGLSGFEHPSDENLEPGMVTRYNSYNGDDNPGTGFVATAYLAAVPFEDPAAATTSTAGATGASRVMCLTCHRAHASSAPSAGRWDFNVTRLSDDGDVSGSWAIPDPYGSPTQGTLCSKCHAGQGPSGSRSPLGTDQDLRRPPKIRRGRFVPR